ncbi:aspartate aminotransferase family protein [Phaeobacter gallaeciensis]|jgi:4-aminobutyrate aminotransferase|uniref:aspartate aminotransferase family protein n=1 Tax=Phaeobacter gallaeciensis TaxID=60890 RepID=UPI00237FB8E8|nr:aspartate aminotransferase family protein [Phaeobacter gallaeciensis]MDE4063662.1 aspartate aminotransferase family protein [Phaeobacter gallaeciensis]MDE4126690.1 aspartate aminotransferase family protein [Phaeobacter gallaeciensis]MDE4131158.1 aspartate aminotransferase family protein [Phaeobacter gallaeciensis]
MTSTSLIPRDEATVSALQKLRFFPLAVTGGHGCTLIEEGGRELLDLSASWGAAGLGHSHSAIRTAVGRALANQAGASILSGTNEPAVELAEMLLKVTPGTDDRRVWLGHSGSDANETVARVVPAATGRPRVIAFSGAYHGGTQGSMSVSGHSAQDGVAKAAGLTLVPYPDPFRPFEGDPSGDALLAHIERLLATTCPGDEVACFFMEPIQADGGLIVPPPSFLGRLSQLCARYGILTVSDEVKVGLGRSGKTHCFQHEGFVPDILVLGKGLGGGLPVSAVIGPSGIMDHAPAFSMQTLHGNPVCASAALAVLTTLQAQGLAAKAQETGRILMNEITRLTSDLPGVGDVRGRGLAIGVELVKKDSNDPDADLARKTVYRAWQLGAVFYYVGMNSNVLELTPPLVLSEDEARTGARILAQAIRDVMSGQISDEDVAAFAGW